VAIVVGVEAVAIAVLGVLACGLLRSHAEVLRALERAAPAGRSRATPVRLGTRARRPPTGASTEGVDVTGTTMAGEPLDVPVRGTGHDTLLAFLSTGCSTCGAFWPRVRDGSAVDELPAGTRVVVVTKGAAQESATRVRELAGEHRRGADGPTVVMSTQAWSDYQVPVTPYFVQVDGTSGRVVGQGSGTTWAHVASLLRQARADVGYARS
jgi:hypothetical protein